MSKKWMAVAGVATLLVAAALLTSCKKSSTTIPSTVIGSGGASGTVSSTTTGAVDASGFPITQGQVTPGTGGGSTPGGGTLPASVVATSANAPGALRPFPHLPDPGIPARLVTSPLPAGEKLPPLTGEPNAADRTIGAVKPGAGVFSRAQYTITFRPYGLGPDSVWGSGLVIRVDSVKPVGKGKPYTGITNHNVLVIPATTDGGTVTTGGKYTGTLTFRSDGTKLLPFLSKVKAQ